MRGLISTLAVLGSTAAWLAVFFVVHPFERARDVLDRAFGALPAWTQVELSDMVDDPLTMDVSRGGKPLESFRILGGFWAKFPGAERIILMGNSQTLLTSLARGESRPSGPEKTYPDIIAERFRNGGSKKLFYRLSAGGLSYEEMLWYAAYLAGRPEVKPDVVLVQLNYQSFMNSGLRDGMLELLSDPAFRRRIEDIVQAGGPDSFGEALRLYASAGKKKIVGLPASPGDRMETAVRKRLDRIPSFNRRWMIYESFLDVLVRCRTYFLHLGSAQKRSLTGSRINASRAALERLAQVCNASGMRMVLFQAPTNPDVSLYATAVDDQDYHGFAASLAARYGLKVFDFEHSIPARYWGMALNLHDPLHLGRDAHRLFAGQMILALEQNGM